MKPEVLADIHAAAFLHSRGWTAQEFADLLASPHCFLIAENDGFALGRVVADEAELLTIATRPEAQGQGIGRQCLTAFKAEARNRGAVSAFLEVAADNVAALALYRAAGWEDAGLRRGYYDRPDGSAVDALLMRRALTQG